MTTGQERPRFFRRTVDRIARARNDGPLRNLPAAVSAGALLASTKLIDPDTLVPAPLDSHTRDFIGCAAFTVVFQRVFPKHFHALSPAIPPVGSSMLYELGQKIGIFEGRFDKWDIAAYALGGASALAADSLARIRQRRQARKSSTA